MCCLFVVVVGCQRSLVVLLAVLSVLFVVLLYRFSPSFS
jgi:hypothetical protein